MKTTLVSLLVAAIASPAWAQSPAERPPGPPPRPPGEQGGDGESRKGVRPGGPQGRHGVQPGRAPFAEVWQGVDQNRDGSLCPEEFRAMRRIRQLEPEMQANLFRRLDKNSDGRLSRGELEAMRRPPGGNAGAQSMPRLMELDTNRDAAVSLAEFRIGPIFAKMPEERMIALFRRLDTDGDGLITPRDRPQPREPRVSRPPVEGREKPARPEGRPERPKHPHGDGQARDEAGGASPPRP